MSYDSPFKRPERSYDRLAFLSPSGSGERYQMLKHPSGMELERVFRCTSCGMDIAVGPCFEHLDPATYVGIVCGCAEVQPLEDPDEALEAVGRAGPTQDEVQSG